LIIATTDSIDGMRTVKTLGLVRDNSVRARHIGKDITAAIRNLVGGEVPEYTKLMAESREQAVFRMVEGAEAMGANAIVATRFVTSMIMGGAAEMVAYGTAVQVEEAAP
jgi:uncharacterized protein YbjQ (UPF0145 family)